MKTFLVALWVFASGVVLAQTSRTDVLYKLDQSAINVKVDELTDTDVLYFESTSPAVKKTIARGQVWKIVYRDGSTEIITAQSGQTLTADQITLVDQSVVVGKVGKRDDRKLYYTKPNDPANTQYELLLTRLDRIQYANGKEEVFRKTAGNTTTSSQQLTSSQQSITNKAPATTSPKPTAADELSSPRSTASYKDPQAFSRIHLTVGPELSLFSQGSSTRWSNELSGLGMNQSIGFSMRFDYRFIKAVAVSLTGGYAQWKLVRNYLQNSVEKYDETIQITRIPVQVGFKVYPFRGLYLLPEAGVNLLMSKVNTSGAHPAPTDVQSSTTPFTYGGSLGYEFKVGGLLLDLSGRYQILSVKELNFGTISPLLTENVQFGSLRLGIGFNTSRK